ncbi:MAG: hypothetical protein QOG67_3875 [Verrucomicrobiota bacterium]
MVSFDELAFQFTGYKRFHKHLRCSRPLCSPRRSHAKAGRGVLLGRDGSPRRAVGPWAGGEPSADVSEKRPYLRGEIICTATEGRDYNALYEMRQ